MNKKIVEKTEIKLIKACLKAIGRGKVAELTLDSVAQDIGVRRSHAVYYFPSKDDLIEATINFVLDQGREYTERATLEIFGSKDILAAYFDVSAAWYLADDDFGSCQMLFFFLGATTSKYQKLCEEFHSMATQRLAKILAIHFKPKTFKETELLAAAQSLRELLIGAYISHSSTGRQSLKATTNRVRKQFFQLARALLQ